MSSTIKIQVGETNTFLDAPKHVARMSLTIANMMDDLGVTGDASNPVILKNVPRPILEKIFEFCQYYADRPDLVKELTKEGREETNVVSDWDKEFLKVSNKTLFEIMLAANFLDIKLLLDACCKTVADMVRGLPEDEIRAMFSLDKPENQ
jgi:S-phase kinase-associated protein 1